MKKLISDLVKTVADFLEVSASKNITLIDKKFHIELGVDTDYKELAIGAIPLIVNLRYSGVKTVSGIALGPWKFSVEFRFNMGMK